MAIKRDVLFEHLIDCYEDSIKDADESWNKYCETNNKRDQKIYDSRLNSQYAYEKMFIHFGYAKEFCNRYPERIAWIIEEAWMDFANEKYQYGNKRATMLGILEEFYNGKTETT